MIQTIIIYTILWLTLYFALKGIEPKINKCQVYRSSYFWSAAVVFALFLGCLIKGLSYEMGTDYVSYVSMFKEAALGSLLSFEKEPGYYFLNRFLFFIGLNLPWIFIINSFIVFFSLLYFASKIKGSVAVSVAIWIFFFYIQSNNLWRQYDALGFVLIAVAQLVKDGDSSNKKRILWFILVSLIASLFHKTAIVYIFIFLGLWIVRKVNMNVLFVIGLMTLSFLYTRVLASNSNFVNGLSTLSLLGYDETYTIFNKFDEYEEYSFLSELKEYIVHAVLILAGDYVLRKKSDNNKLRFLYYIVAFYFVLYPFGRFHSLIVRILMYAQIFLPFYFGLVFYHYKKSGSKVGLSKLYYVALYGILALYTLDFYQLIGTSTESIGHGYQLYPF
jgi:hypothetical protein